MKNAGKLLLVLVILTGFISCQEDKFGPTIFVDSEVDSTAYTYDFDQWLYKSFTVPYNCEFKYKMDDAAMDPNYNVVPVRLGMADTLAHLALYLWYNAYDTIMNRVGDSTFLYDNGPRMIQLVGSSMINAAQGTEKLGYAEGGIKITLMKINKMDWSKMDTLNEYVFNTMHHEFSHILHQKKLYPKDFESITPGIYDPTGWQYREDESVSKKDPKYLWKREHAAWELGCVTCYASSETHEDFVETIAQYVTRSDEDWQYMLSHAGAGAPLIEQKLSMAAEWLEEQWKINLQALHDEVQIRQKYLTTNYDQIMKCNFDFKTYPNYVEE